MANPEKANSVRLVFPKQTMPARVARASTRASASGTRSAKTGEPPVVATPAESTRSFHEIGTPSSGPMRRPALARSRAAPASASARSGVVRR